MKLFVIEQFTHEGWHPAYLHRGEFRWALNRAHALMGLCTRVRRVKTPAERDQYLHLTTMGDKTARTEWVN